jgi:restriction enzyme bgcI subunit beta
MSKLTLDSVEWREFFIGGKEGLFHVLGTNTTHPSKLIPGGNTPRVTCAATNNAIDDFYYNPATEEGGVLTVDSATIGYVSYQLNDFIATDHVEKIVGKNQKINKYIGLFLKTCIDNSKLSKYGYGYKFSQKRIVRQKILLPITSNGNPDWQFMEDYIKQEISLQSQSLSSYYEDKLIKLAFDLLNTKEQSDDSPCFDFLKNTNSEFNLYKPDKDCVSNLYKENLFNEIYTIATNWKEKYSLEDTEWKEFFIEDVCEINSGKDIYERERIDGNTPYVTATASNNGIGYFISNKNTTYQKNCISVNRNGSVGYSFYHEYGALFGNDTRKLTPKIKDPYIAKFISFMISEQKDKYGYGYKMGTGRLKRQKILLPVQEDDTIDYNFMRKYMITREVEIIQNILKRYSN